MDGCRALQHSPTWTEKEPEKIVCNVRKQKVNDNTKNKNKDLNAKEIKQDKWKYKEVIKIQGFSNKMINPQNSRGWKGGVNVKINHYMGSGKVKGCWKAYL